MRCVRIFILPAVLTLAAGCAMERQMDQFNQELDVVKALHENLKGEMEHMKAEQEKLHRELKKLQKSVKALRDELKSKETQLKSQHKAVLDDKKSIITRLEADLKLQSERVKTLSKQKTDTEIALRKKLREQKEQFEKKIKQLESAAKQPATQPAPKTKKAKS